MEKTLKQIERSAGNKETFKLKQKLQTNKRITGKNVENHVRKRLKQYFGIQMVKKRQI